MEDFPDCMEMPSVLDTLQPVIPVGLWRTGTVLYESIVLSKILFYRVLLYALIRKKPLMSWINVVRVVQVI